jgi:DNA replication and repair protein RecF
MILQNIQLRNFRNLSSAQIELAPGFNFFFGENGAGKTSILESIYYLGLGRSFRSNSWRNLTSHQADFFSLKAQVADMSDADNCFAISHKRAASGERTISIAGDEASSQLELARLLPIQYIGVDTNLLFSAPTSDRRRFMDWGVFHLQPIFYPSWLSYCKLLKQRNCLLKKNPAYSELRSWDLAMEECAACLDSCRASYCEKFSKAVDGLWQEFGLPSKIDIRYRRGWDSTVDFAAALKSSYEQDLRYGNTRCGPHRAGFTVYCNDRLAVEVLSQGQQKLLSYVLRLCQGIVMHTDTDESPIYLIDDLASEFDDIRVGQVLRLLGSLKAQVLITAVYSKHLPDNSPLLAAASSFRVKDGTVETYAQIVTAD